MEPLNLLQALPDHARVWMYAADRSLNEDEEARLVELLETFCESWRSHGRRVESAVTVLEGRFAVIAGDIPSGDISGCGIDASVHALDQAAEELGLHWLPALSVHYRAEDGSIVSVSRGEFRSMVASVRVTAHTRVFDLSVETLDGLRRGHFEQPAVATWHGRVFRITDQSVSS